MAEHRQKTSTRRERNDRRDEHRRHQHRRKQNIDVDQERRVRVDQRSGYQRRR